MKCPRRPAVAAALLIIPLYAALAARAAVPPAGSAAPPLNIADLDGNAFEPARVRDKPCLLIFGELYHKQTREACAEIERVLGDQRFAGDGLAPVLIVAQRASRLELKTQAESLGFAGIILHDPDRRAFADYRISVMPSVVVVGRDQKVIHSLPGLTARFADVLADSLLVSLGRLSPARFEETLRGGEANALNEEQVRANRLTLLARQLARRGLDDMAEEKYGEALHLWPESTEARLGLGRLHLKRRRIAEAETQFRAVLAASPDLVEATLGVAYVQTIRGGDELAEAERLVRGVLDRDASQPRAHYLLGLIHEQRNRMNEAAASFRRAAELLLERQVVE